MDMNSGVNPAQSDIVREVYQEERGEKGGYHREPPPAYDATYNYVPPVPPAPVTNPPITHQPVTNQPQTRSIIVHLPLKHSPTLFSCPKCDERIVTSVTYSSTNKTHMLAGFVCGISWISGQNPKQYLSFHYYCINEYWRLEDQMLQKNISWCCLCCLAAIPYLTKFFKEAQHTCPNCKANLGSYSKF